MKVSDLVSNGHYEVTEAFASLKIGDHVVVVISRLSSGQYSVGLIGPKPKTSQGLTLDGDDDLPLK